MKTYYMLTKPGIIIGNAITTAGGFALASKNGFDFVLFFITLIGLSLVIASAGVFNNYIDRFMDAKMERTKHRPLVTGQVSGLKALVFASLVGIAGFSVLLLYTNLLTASIAACGFIVYLVLYAYLKSRSFYGTLIGSIAGATPPVVGYCAAGGSLDMAAGLLFLMMLLWQMPHFFSIALYRLDDYKQAAVPVLPIIKGITATKKQIFTYILFFIAVTFSLTIFGYTGILFGSLTIILGFIWLKLSYKGFNLNASQETTWARQMFICSLVVILSLYAVIPFDY